MEQSLFKADAKLLYRIRDGVQREDSLIKKMIKSYKVSTSRIKYSYALLSIGAGKYL